MSQFLNFDPFEAVVEGWAEKRGAEEVDIFSLARLVESLPAHVDGLANNRAFIISLGMIGYADWRTQLMTVKKAIIGYEDFSYDRLIASFRQNAGDAVLIPPYSIHETKISARRAARTIIAQEANLTCR